MWDCVSNWIFILVGLYSYLKNIWQIRWGFFQSSEQVYNIIIWKEITDFEEFWNFTIKKKYLSRSEYRFVIKTFRSSKLIFSKNSFNFSNFSTWELYFKTNYWSCGVWTGSCLIKQTNWIFKLDQNILITFFFLNQVSYFIFSCKNCSSAER